MKAYVNSRQVTQHHISPNFVIWGADSTFFQTKPPLTKADREIWNWWFCFIYHNIRYIWYFFPNPIHIPVILTGLHDWPLKLFKDSNSSKQNRNQYGFVLSLSALVSIFLSSNAMIHKLQYCGLELQSQFKRNCSNNHNIACVSDIFSTNFLKY